MSFRYHEYNMEILSNTPNIIFWIPKNTDSSTKDDILLYSYLDASILCQVAVFDIKPTNQYQQCVVDNEHAGYTK